MRGMSLRFMDGDRSCGRMLDEFLDDINLFSCDQHYFRGLPLPGLVDVGMLTLKDLFNFFLFFFIFFCWFRHKQGYIPKSGNTGSDTHFLRTQLAVHTRTFNTIR
jgi:hypothetical protein